MKIHLKGLLFLLFSVLILCAAGPDAVWAQDDLSAPVIPEVGSDLSDEASEEESLLPVLKIHYFLEGDEEPFLITTYLNEPGYQYNILHPAVEGYRPEEARLLTMVTEDTDLDIEYTLQTYSLLIHYRLLDGKPAAPDYQSQAAFGSEYEFTTPTVAGYTAVEKEIRGTMPGRDLERTVFYVAGTPIFIR